MALIEAQWLECKSITLPVMRALRKHGSDRKCYLAAVASLRQIEHLLTDPRSRAVIEIIERFADGQASLGDMHAAHGLASAAEFLGPPMQATKEDMKRQYAGMAAIYASTPPDESLAPRNGPRGVWFSAYNTIDKATNAGNPRESRPRIAATLHDILGNPFRPVTVDPRWKTGNVVSLAQAIYDERAFDRMPILADAMEEAGCQEQSILTHCRSGGDHVRGCWVVDLLLGRL